MTLNFTRSELITAIHAMSPYIVSKGAVSLRVAEGGMLDLFATAFIEGGSALVRVPCDQTHKPVPWTHVDGTVLQQAIQMADEGVVALEFAKDKLTLKYPGAVFELRTLTPPITPEKIKFGKTSAHIRGSDLNLLSAMTEAASTEETRPALNGIHISASEKKLEAAAADGYILSFATLASKGLSAPGATYSVKALNRAKRAIKAGEEEEIAIGFGNHSLTLSAQRGNIELTFEVPRMDSGKFPDYMAVVKGADKAQTVEVETSALNAFLRRATVIQGAVFMQAINGFLWLLAKNETTGEQCLDSLVVEAQGESAVMLYAYGLLKDTLKACVPNGKVTLTFPKANKSPMLFKGAASVIAMPLVNPLQESPFKGLQPALI
jgi:DNA polymerase III sliding clamp (beta) subunit (PCNA family)